MSKFLIAGLGNIGDEYAGTRHNVGFEIADELAADAGTLFRNDRLASVAEFKFKGKQIILIKPTTYMNLSGKAINYWLQAEKIKPENLLVLVDELAFPFGQIRIHPKGSDGGHNGLKDIQAALGTQQYARLRFGIAATFGKGRQVDYVLGKWNEEERKTLHERIKTAGEAVKMFVFAGLQPTMNFYNSK
ncbi:MAG TPA: aminoacyl-tRNA hydrolase [Bacteroidia bacterium]|jgi:PTH1 family peptidyl-tRNA hydrolase|nr:aminoacyl-tRNA hydrolase [Bacteroidia bacterium]